MCKRVYAFHPSFYRSNLTPVPAPHPPCCTPINHLCVAANSSDMSVVASYGFVVVAPMSCPTAQCGAKYATDMIATIRAIQNNEITHPGLAHADPNRTAVYGHSMGAMAAMKVSATCNVQRCISHLAHVYMGGTLAGTVVVGAGAGAGAPLPLPLPLLPVQILGCKIVTRALTCDARVIYILML